MILKNVPNITLKKGDIKEAVLKMQLFCSDLSDPKSFEKAIKRSTTAGYAYPIKIDPVNKTYEILPKRTNII